jgi:hypothetical protein
MQKNSLHPLVAASAVLLTLANAPLGAEGAEIERQAALRAHVTFLADDLLEGRGAGTRGYDLAAQYVSTQFMRLGLEPAGENTNWFQPVPLVESRLVEGSAQLSIQYGEKEKTLMHEEEFLVWPHPVRELTALRAPVSFVGLA